MADITIRRQDEMLQTLFQVRSKDTLPYARLVTGTLERRLASFSAPEFPRELHQGRPT